jgi:hypothetical protein
MGRPAAALDCHQRRLGFLAIGMMTNRLALGIVPAIGASIEAGAGSFHVRGVSVISERVADVVSEIPGKFSRYLAGGR